VLSWSADKFVYGASALAKNLGVSPMMIGLTIVAMGSSAPEIVVAATASLGGNIDTAVGNALGSNITNIALVLGISALIKPLLVSSTTLKRELPIMLVISLLAVYFIDDSFMSRVEGIVLITLFVLVIAGMAVLSFKVDKNDPLIAETETEVPSNVDTSYAIFWVLIGLVLLPGVLKGEDDLALGNIIGSNIFNLLAVLAMPGLIAPGIIDANAASRDALVMLGVSILLFVFCFNLRGTRRINRWEGFAFVAIFISYQIWLFI